MFYVQSNWNEENFDDWELMSENFSCLSHITGIRGTSGAYLPRFLYRFLIMDQ
jgi:hypothetical protein